MIVVVVLAALTVCATPAETLPLKFASPPYVAVPVLFPAAVDVSVQFAVYGPAPVRVPVVQLLVPSLIVTVPVGVPDPLATLTATT